MIAIRVQNGTSYDATAALNNQLLAQGTTSDTNWNVTVTGHVDGGTNNTKWYNTWAACRGITARVGTNDGNFSLPNVPLYPGTNELVVTVQDVSGNWTQQVRHVNRTAQEIMTYDGNGNLTNWLSGTNSVVYQWDWADRLTKVTSNGVVVLQNWYDASGRRIAKKEVVSGQTNYALYVWDGWGSVAVLNQSAQILESYTRGVGLPGDIGTLVAVTHHAGTNAGSYYTHHNHRGDVVVMRSGTTNVGSYAYSPFGILNSTLGTDLCRFKFSSKERDAATGFSYYGYRFYSPLWQRWANRDPLSESGFEILGLGSYVKHMAPSRWLRLRNLFSFCNNRPLVSLDLFGLETYDECIADCNKEFLQHANNTLCLAKRVGAAGAAVGAALGATLEYLPGTTLWQKLGTTAVMGTTIGGLGWLTMETLGSVSDALKYLGCITSCGIEYNVPVQGPIYGTVP